jgi:hypothetical protein
LALQAREREREAAEDEEDDAAAEERKALRKACCRCCGMRPRRGMREPFALVWRGALSLELTRTPPRAAAAACVRAHGQATSACTCGASACTASERRTSTTSWSCSPTTAKTSDFASPRGVQRLYKPKTTTEHARGGAGALA